MREYEIYDKPKSQKIVEEMLGQAKLDWHAIHSLLLPKKPRLPSISLLPPKQGLYPQIELISPTLNLMEKRLTPAY